MVSMKQSVKLEPALAFLNDLASNNNKAWFDANRVQDEQAKAVFEEFVRFCNEKGS